VLAEWVLIQVEQAVLVEAVPVVHTVFPENQEPVTLVVVVVKMQVVVLESLLFATFFNKSGITRTYFSLHIHHSIQLFLKNYISHTPLNESSIAASVAYLFRVHAA
jgi:hypothetical protein